MNTSEKATWQRRIDDMVKTLRSLETGVFYDDLADRYHPIYEEIVAFSELFEINRSEIAAVLARNPVARQCWLPTNANELGSMSAAEIYWRLGENLADERWVDGALAEPFESGVLSAALEHLCGQLDTFRVKAE